MPSKYRVAVIGRSGKGNYGHHVDTVWLKVPNAEIVSVADDDAKGLVAAAKRLNVAKAYADYREMLDKEKPDIVAICQRWIDQHGEMALAAAERGIHIFMEKPFCRTLAEADKIVEACERTHAKLALAHPTRYSPTIPTLRKLIADGEIGQVLELRGRGKEDHRGGGEDLWVLGSHIMDMILGLGYTPEWCFANVLVGGEPVTAKHVAPGNEGIGSLAGDAVRAMFGLKEGVTASFGSYRNARGNPSRFGLRVYGSQGIIEMFEGVLPPAFILKDPGWASGRSTNIHWQKISSAGIAKSEPLSDEKYQDRQLVAVENLLSCIESQEEPACGVYEGRKIVEMIAAIFESHRVSAPVRFPLENRENPLDRL